MLFSAQNVSMVCVATTIARFASSKDASLVKHQHQR
jgi:hypothetical protein